MLQWHRDGAATWTAFSLVLFLKRNLRVSIKTNCLREMIPFHVINRKMPNKGILIMHLSKGTREIDVLCKVLQDILLCSSYKISCKINCILICENPCLYCCRKAPNRQSICKTCPRAELQTESHAAHALWCFGSLQIYIIFVIHLKRDEENTPGIKSGETRTWEWAASAPPACGSVESELPWRCKYSWPSNFRSKYAFS